MKTMKTIVLNPATNIPIVVLLVIGLLMASSGDIIGPAWRALSEVDMKKTRGGEPCTVVTCILVAAAVCTIATFGWLVIKEFWNGKTTGDKTTAPLPNTTIIRQQTYYADGECLASDVYEVVQEHQEVTPNTCSGD